ncbi:ATP-binding cassette domain-containing protein [Janibacter melonis]|uniref:ATP-binding cassette domain-containing protein n=1 Tax=Janibacter melonis TaxID=262209 RepID=UPI00209440C5|nr:ATP-binding cassette domain-containing protein [Janibacter melonis]
MTAVAVTDLHRSFGSVRAVDGATLTAELGEITCVLGPNGAGKTTTVECLEGLQRPDSGSVRVLGTDPGTPMPRTARGSASCSRTAGCPSRSRRIACSPISSGCTAASAVATSSSRPSASPLRPHRRAPAQRGQRQRLALAAALVGRPEVAFLGEPAAGLDPTPSARCTPSCAA